MRGSHRWVECLALFVLMFSLDQCWAQSDVSANDATAEIVSAGSSDVSTDDKRNELMSGELASVIERFTYAAIIGVLLLCGMGLPLPEEVPILTSAILAASGTLRPWWALGALMFGVMAGDSAMFWLGHRWGSRLFEHRLARRMLTPDRNQKIADYFQKYGAWIIFVARFLPGLRAPLFLTSGSMKVPFWIFFAMDGAAALISIPTSFWLAYYFTDQLEQVLAVRDTVQYWAFGALVAFIVIGMLVKRWWKRRSGSTGGLPS